MINITTQGEVLFRTGGPNWLVRSMGQFGGGQDGMFGGVKRRQVANTPHGVNRIKSGAKMAWLGREKNVIGDQLRLEGNVDQCYESRCGFNIRLSTMLGRSQYKSEFESLGMACNWKCVLVEGRGYNVTTMQKQGKIDVECLQAPNQDHRKPVCSL